MTRITTAVETVSITDIKAGDTILRESGERVTVAEVISCVPHLLTYRDAKGQDRLAFGDCALRVVPDEPAEEPVWPDADLIRIIRGTENTIRVDGSLADRTEEGYYRLLTGPRKHACIMKGVECDSIEEWEEVVPVAKSEILASLGTPTEDDEPENDDSESESEDEAEDEDDCDGSCLACLFMRLIAAAANQRESEEATE
jgi:hypothetical protein